MVTHDRQIDRRILLEADSLEAAGWNVRIVAMPLDVPALHEDRRVIRIGAGTDPAPRRETLVLELYRSMRRLIPMNSTLMRALKAFAWRHVVDQESFYRNLFQTELSRHVADVYLAHDLPMLPVAAAASRAHGAKLVFDSHELFAEQEFSDREKRRWRDIESRYIGSCDAVMTVNPSIAQELQQRYGLANVHVVYNAERRAKPAISTRLFHEKLSLPPEARVLLFQGGLSAGRNLETLVESMVLVRDSTIHLVVLGDGQMQARLARLANGNPRVHFIPAVPQAELMAWTGSASAGVIPYQATCLNNYYCTPNKLFEFIAAGLPILASNLPEIRRIVEENGVGRVADMESGPAFASAIDEFFRSDEQLQAWRDAARGASQVIAWEVEGQKIVDIFEALH